jgi:hypothetical protein
MARLVKYAGIIACIILTAACERETFEPYGCNVSPKIDSLYRLDAYRLLLHEIYYDSLHPDRVSPRFNETKVLKILGAFQAVYDLNVPERDTIIEQYDIHVYPVLGLYSISLKVDPSAGEIQNLVNGQVTGNAQLDTFLSTYAFDQVSTSMFYPDFNWITITSDSAWNLIPLWEHLKTFDFIYDAGMGDGAMGDGNTIVLERKAQSLLLDFSIGWGDCPSGCINRKHWRFEISNACQASIKE